MIRLNKTNWTAHEMKNLRKQFGQGDCSRTLKVRLLMMTLHTSEDLNDDEVFERHAFATQIRNQESPGECYKTQPLLTMLISMRGKT